MKKNDKIQINQTVWSFPVFCCRALKRSPIYFLRKKGNGVFPYFKSYTEDSNREGPYHTPFSNSVGQI